MQVLAMVLSQRLNVPTGGSERYGSSWTSLSMSESASNYCEVDPVVGRSLPALFDVLLTVQPGDSQMSLAERCDWPKLVTDAERAA